MTTYSDFNVIYCLKCNTVMIFLGKDRYWCGNCRSSVYHHKDVIQYWITTNNPNSNLSISYTVPSDTLFLFGEIPL